MKGTHHTVLFCFLLNITNFLGDLLETVLVVCILKLQFYIGDLIKQSDHLDFAKESNVTNLAASVVLVVVPLRCDESGCMPKKVPRRVLSNGKFRPTLFWYSREGTKPQITSINFTASGQTVTEKHPIAQNASSFAYKR